MALLTDMATFKAVFLASSKHIIVVAGAGLSSASGIPTFRGAGGMWRKYDAVSLATPEAFAANPGRVWQFYHYRREKALEAKPNAAHIALARFSLPNIRQRSAPGSTFTLITQNVDGLSQRALDDVLSSEGSPVVRVDEPLLIEMHGRLFELQCTDESCGHTEPKPDSLACSALAGTECLVESGIIEPNIAVDDLPRCSKCGELARPAVIWFGEIPRFMDTIDKLVGRADLCLVVGTSSTVFPAAGYAYEVQDHGGKVAVFNLERSAGDGDADFLFLGPCEVTLPEALGLANS